MRPHEIYEWFEHAEPQITEEHRAQVQGALPDEIFEQIEWWRLTWWTRAAIRLDLNTEWAVDQSQVLEEDGRLRAPFQLSPFDEEGYTLLKPAGFADPIARLHYSRLMPGAPLT
jgi:hypothetical protein